MSVEHAKAFLEKVQNDPDFKRKLQNTPPEKAKNLIESQGWSFTKEEFAEAYKSRMGREMNEEELSQVAAGNYSMPLFGM